MHLAAVGVEVDDSSQHSGHTSVKRSRTLLAVCQIYGQICAKNDAIDIRSQRNHPWSTKASTCYDKRSPRNLIILLEDEQCTD